jgi:xanthine dehydrogenase accessory factor
MTGASNAVTAADAARAASEAARGGVPVSIVVAIAPAPLAGDRILRWADGTTRGTLGDAALDDSAVQLADAALAGAPPGRHAVEVSAGEVFLYVEAHHSPERLIVVGAGHIGVPLARLGVRLGFAVTVLDDRAEFATGERVGAGIDVRRADFEGDPFAGVVIDERSYIALVTRGHRWDFDCLRLLLDAGTRPRYIGMIGSRRRVRAALLALLRAGYARAELTRVVAPIGLDIGAETPEEIAVSIAAELVLFRRGGTGAPRSVQESVLERLVREPLEEVDGGS